MQHTRHTSVFIANGLAAVTIILLIMVFSAAFIAPGTVTINIDGQATTLDQLTLPQKTFTFFGFAILGGIALSCIINFRRLVLLLSAGNFFAVETEQTLRKIATSLLLLVIVRYLAEVALESVLFNKNLTISLDIDASLIFVLLLYAVFRSLAEATAEGRRQKQELESIV